MTFATNVSLDGYITSPGDDLGWSLPSDQLFPLWSRVAATGQARYSRKLWEKISAHWPTADRQPDVDPGLRRLPLTAGDFDDLQG